MAGYNFALWDGSKLKEGKNYSKKNVYKSRSQAEAVLWTLKEDGKYGGRIYRIKEGYVILKRNRAAKEKDKRLK